MKKFARLLSMVLAVATVLSLCIGAFDYVDAADITKGKEKAIDAVYNWGIMQGNDKGEFNPKGNLTRAEMSKIMYALQMKGLSVEDYYGDLLDYAVVDADKVPAWSKGYVGYAFIQETFLGNEKNEINARGNLSYVEATIVLLRAMGLGTTEDQDGKTIDRYTGANWMMNAFIDGSKCGLFKGLDIANFSAAITREDVAVMIYNAEANFKGFTLAEEVSGVVTGVWKDNDKNECFVLDGENSSYQIGDLNVADYMGKKISFWAEKDEQANTEIVDESKAVVVTTVGAIENDDKKWTVDGKELAKVEDVKSFYLFMNNTMNGVKADLAKMDLDGEQETNGFQNITLINNGDSISIVYNPVIFKMGKDIEIKAEVKDKKYTGKYYVEYEGNTYYIDQTKFDKDVWYALSFNDNQVVTDNGIVTTIALADLTVKNGTILYNGKEMKVYSKEGFGDLVTPEGIEKRLKVTDKNSADYYGAWNLYVYNNAIFGWTAKEAAPEKKSDIAYILDVEETISAGKVTYTVEAIVNDKVVTFDYTSEVTVDNFYTYKAETTDNKTTYTLGESAVSFVKCDEKTDTAEIAKNNTIVVYDKNLETVVGADKLTIKDNYATYGGTQYVADVFEMADFGNGYYLFVFGK